MERRPVNAPEPPRIPRATYRVQFHRGFTFDDALAASDYLARLGVSHLYASPYLKARPDSKHGYDIVDHNALNPELGGDAGYRRMTDALASHGLSQILDFVPNHMGIGGSDNPVWLDVLEWGQDSVHAGWFDIDWNPDSQYLRGKLLVPFLSGQYGDELARGSLELKFDPEQGGFAVWAYGVHKLPICPLHYPQILGDAHPQLERMADLFAGLPQWRPQMSRRAAELKEKLATLAATDSDAFAHLHRAVQDFQGAPDELASWKRLNELIAVQNWRASYFRVAADDINYRRFFNINDLAGLRMESAEVFERMHQLLFRLIREATVTGVRIDHIDGLFDPKRYLIWLREKTPRPEFYCVVEKILAHHESLRVDWPVQGTTGYEFANLVLGILIAPESEEAFTRAYAGFIGRAQEYSGVVRDSKLWIIENQMASELNVLAREAARIARQNPRTADFTRHLLARALRELVACFPVYRTYVDEDSPATESDRRYLDWAIAQASRRQTSIDPSVYEFLRGLLSGEIAVKPGSGFNRSAALRCAMRFQQYSGPLMAKGVEDTAFYRYHRFVALNEVGGNPDQFGIGLSAFHNANMERARNWPQAMLSTATHDTKRGEDTRARLAVLSEIPDEWSRHVQTWSRILRARRGDVERSAPPDRNDEYLFYQLLTGTWPMELLPDVSDTAILGGYTERVCAAMIKSVREAKLQSRWAAPNLAYEDALLGFVRVALDPEAGGAFFADFLPFVSEVARYGAHNSLTQTVLKLTVPGVPDIYQGTELWDFSMVDPDNRRDVDYAVRASLLDEIEADLSCDQLAVLRRYFGEWRNPRFKLAVIKLLLEHRHSHEELFSAGTYQPVQADGPGADQICAFVRRCGEDCLFAVTGRHPVRLERAALTKNTFVPVPEVSQRIRWRDLLTGTEFPAADRLAMEDVFASMPAAVLVPA